MDQPTPALTAHIDQQAITVREMAKVLGAYKRSLMESGISPEQAAELVSAYAETYWHNVLHRCCPCGSWDED